MVRLVLPAPNSIIKAMAVMRGRIFKRVLFEVIIQLLPCSLEIAAFIHLGDKQIKIPSRAEHVAVFAEALRFF